MILLDGTQTATAIRNELKQAVDALTAQGKRAPHLAAILIGENPASVTYVNSKVKACTEVGYRSSLITYTPQVTEAELLQKLQALNTDPGVDGILVQLPLPKHIAEARVIETIVPEKDVDGFHPINLGRLAQGQPALHPATPAGIIELLKRYGVTTTGKHAVVVGRSNIVGTPISLLLSRNNPTGNATVTLCHTKTPDFTLHTRMADIVVMAAGQPQILKADMVKDGAVVVDVGIHRVPDASKKSGFRLCGDVDFAAVSPRCSYITPVPGGVGPMTIAMLLRNTYQAFAQRHALSALS
jgi:methylenetetrahydrofolate dehydrogenase (NADP+)/methenyltetrahydrofolate cyclohydrolase